MYKTISESEIHFGTSEHMLLTKNIPNVIKFEKKIGAYICAFYVCAPSFVKT
jgi:hypothetical protein